MSQKTINIIIIVLISIAIIIGIFAFIQSNKQPAPRPDGTLPPKQGFGAALGTVLSQAIEGDWWKNLVGQKKCDPNNLGFQIDGVYNPSKCGTPSGLECDPNRAGWNKAGFLDVNC